MINDQARVGGGDRWTGVDRDAGEDVKGRELRHGMVDRREAEFSFTF